MTVWFTPPEEDQVVARLRADFQERWEGAPDGVWAAPGRVNLIGEHVDYNAGLCLPMALPHRTYAAVRVRGDDRLRLASRQSEGVWEGRLDDIGPGRPRGWAGYAAGVLYAVRESGTAVPGLDVLVDGHVPVGAGLSSSAALSCSVAVALAERVASVGALGVDWLTQVCVRAENDVVGAATGGMDQAVSLRAETGHALALDCRDFSVRQVPFDLPGVEVLVIDTRAEHSLADGQYARRRRTCEEAAARLGVGSLREVEDLDAALGALTDDEQVRRVRHVVTEIERVRRALPRLREGDAAGFGALMDASHESLRDDYEVSCRELDVAVEAARAAGALGARMTGGGFGGSAIALVDASEVERVARRVEGAFGREGRAAPAFASARPSTGAGRVG